MCCTLEVVSGGLTELNSVCGRGALSHCVVGVMQLQSGGKSQPLVFSCSQAAFHPACRLGGPAPGVVILHSKFLFLLRITYPIAFSTPKL